MERIIEQLLSPDTNAINQATRDLDEAFKHAEAIEALCNVMTSHQNSDVRQYAAVLLRKKLEKLRNYQQVPANSLMHIKNNMMTAIFAEKENFVRGAMTQFFGCVLRHEERTDEAWVDGVVKFIVAQCASNDPQTVENASFVMAKLSDETPEPFVQRFDVVGELIRAALVAANNTTENAFPATVMYNILTTMSALVPVILGNSTAQKTYQEAVPYLTNIIKKFADETAIAHFTIGLEVLQAMTECTPALLNSQMRLIMEFTLGISSNANYDAEIRIKALAFVPILVTEKKKLLVKLKLIEPMLAVLFEIMATEPETDDPDEFFIESDSETILAAANVAVDVMAVNMPPEKFIPPLLKLLEPALQNQSDDLRRRAAYIVLASISEGCREAICNSYIEPMLNILKNGLNDPASSVRSAALFAVGQFSEQLQPEIADYADQVLPQLLKYMQDVLQAQQLGQRLEEKLVERLFYALEAFCENMNKGLAPFMESIMTMVLIVLSGQFPQRLHILVMELTESAAKAYKGSLLPWFQPLVERLQPLLLQADTQQTDPDGIRSQALNTLAETARNIEQEFRPYVQHTMEHCVQSIESSVDPDVRKALFNLFGALASIVGEDMATVLPILLTHIERCLDEGTDLPPQLIACGGGSGGKTEPTKSDAQKNADNANYEIDLDEPSDGEDDSEVASQIFMGDNPYLQAKDQAVYTIKEIAESCPSALLQYNQKLFEAVYKLIDNPCLDLRCSSIAAANTLVIKWFEQVGTTAIAAGNQAKQATQILLTKLIEIVRKDLEKEVVLEAQDAIGDLLSNMGQQALPTPQLRDSIVQCIRDGLTNNYDCQYGNNLDDGGAGDGVDANDDDDEDNSESDKAVIEGAAELLTALGKASPTEEYAGYFKQLEPLVMKRLKSATVTDSQSLRAFLIGVLAECYPPMGRHIAPYFPQHSNMLVGAAKERNAKIRQNAIFALGELVRAAGDVSFRSFPIILSTLSDVVANERKRVIVDNIIGTLARLILTNVSLVPLDHVLPVMLQKLPIQDDQVECNVVIECFQLLFQSMPAERMQPHVGAVVAISIQSIATPQTDCQLVDNVVCLINQIRSLYPAEYQEALTNPLLVSLLPVAQNQAGGRL